MFNIGIFLSIVGISKYFHIEGDFLTSSSLKVLIMLVFINFVFILVTRSFIDLRDIFKVILFNKDLDDEDQYRKYVQLLDLLYKVNLAMGLLMFFVSGVISVLYTIFITILWIQPVKYVISRRYRRYKNEY